MSLRTLRNILDGMVMLFGFLSLVFIVSVGWDAQTQEIVSEEITLAWQVFMIAAVYTAIRVCAILWRN